MEVELQHCAAPHLSAAAHEPGHHDAKPQRPPRHDKAKTIRTPGGDAMEPRITELETRFEYIHRDLNEVRNDVKSIKGRLTYIAGAAAVIGAPLVWIANNRMDQILLLLTS
ncbi:MULTISPECIES: hypothetical protein [Pseudomonas]|nr:MULTISPECIES: hypothetical protein [Pseudomonas]